MLTGVIETRGFDFSRKREIEDGGVLDTAELEQDPEDELTLGTPEVDPDENTVVFTVATPASGSGSSTHKIKCIATLEDGRVIALCGTIKVRDCVVS